MSKEFNQHSTADEVLEGLDLHGKRVFITGVSSGLGRETARALVAHGAYVIGSVRNANAASDATAPIVDAAKKSGGALELVEMDLSDLASVRAAAALTLASGKKIDLLIANAGIMAKSFSKTVDGFEQQFAINFLSHFVLAKRLASAMPSGSRLISLTSNAHRISDIDLNDLNFSQRDYDPVAAYGASKTASSLLAVAFDNRYRERGIRAAAVHPGTIQTGLTRNLDHAEFEATLKDVNDQHIALGNPPFQPKTIEQGAATTLWAGIVADADVIGGAYCEDCGLGHELSDANVSALSGGYLPYAVDAAHADELWAEALLITGETQEQQLRNV